MRSSFALSIFWSIFWLERSGERIDLIAQAASPGYTVCVCLSIFWSIFWLSEAPRRIDLVAQAASPAMRSAFALSIFWLSEVSSASILAPGQHPGNALLIGCRSPARHRFRVCLLAERSSFEIHFSDSCIDLFSQYGEGTLHRVESPARR